MRTQSEDDARAVQHVPPRGLRSLIQPWHIASVICAAALLVGFNGYQLLDPDEGRYAEVPREMLERHDFITPTLNYVPYLEKPPLMYWASAASFALLGDKPQALRLVNGLCAVAGMFVAAWLATLCFGKPAGRWAGAVLASSLLFFSVGRIPIIDMMVSVLFAATLTAWYAGVKASGRVRSWYYVLSGIFLGLSLLAKGPVCVVLFAGILLLYMLATRKLGHFVPAAGLPIIVSCLVAAPWFVAVAKANANFVHFFFWEQHVQRFLGHGIPEHVKPFWYYFALILPGMFLWSIYWGPMAHEVKHRFRQWPAERRDAIIFCTIWAAVVVLFFSASTCKLIQYILPAWWPFAVGSAAWVEAEFHREHSRRRLHRPTTAAAGILLFVLVAVLLVAGRQHKVPPELLSRPVLYFGLAMVGSISCLIAAPWMAHRSRALGLLTIGAMLPLLGLIPAYRVVTIGKDLGGLLPAQVCPLPPNSGWTIAQWGVYNQSLNFYTHQRVKLIDCVSEIKLGLDEPDAAEWFLTGENKIAELAAQGPLLLVVNNDDAERLSKTYHLRLWAINSDRASLLNQAGVRALERMPVPPNGHTP